MATLAKAPHRIAGNDSRFFMISAIVMAMIVFAGFSVQLAMGRSSFAAPPLVHAHAIVFMGWVVLYVLQNIFVATGNIALHRRLGWVGAVWVVAMVVLGCMVTLAIVRRGHVPFFFHPLQFLVFDPMTLFVFAGLTTAAILLRRQTAWHRRLHFCGMAILTGPAFGRLLPLPLMAPWGFEAVLVAVMLLPLAGIIADRRRTGRIHPAWACGSVAIIGSLVISNAIAYGPLGPPLYNAITAGSPGAAVSPLALALPPEGPQVTGRTH